MSHFIQRVRVIVTATATWLTATVVLLTTVAPELPEDWQTWALRIAAWIGGAVTFIRRHTPVEPRHRGVLSVGPKRHYFD